VRSTKVLVLILILGFGAAVETAWSVRQNLGLGPLGCRILRGKFHGPSFAFEEQQVHKLDAGSSVEVENAFGTVSVSEGAEGEVRVTLRKVVYAPREEEARQLASRVELTSSEAGSALRIGTNRKEVDRRDEVGFETHLDLALPPRTAVKVANEHGRVEVRDVARAEVSASFDALRVEGVAGDAVIEGSHGDVSASRIGGSLSLTSRHGNVEVQDVEGRGSLDVAHGDLTTARTGGLVLKLAHGDLEAREVRGDLQVEGRHASVQAEDVTGRVQVETSYRGVRLSRVGGDARVKTAHGEVEASDVAGTMVAEASYDDVVLARIKGHVEVTVEHGGLRADGLEAGARVKASGDDVILQGFRGAVAVEARRGGVQLEPGGPLTEPVSVKASNGGIELEVPPGSRFRLDAETRRGSLDVDVPGLAVSFVDRDHATGVLGGGGSLVHLAADHGDIKVTPLPTVAAKDP